jgi:hypothetical protein
MAGGHESVSLPPPYHSDMGQGSAGNVIVSFFTLGLGQVTQERALAALTL